MWVELYTGQAALCYSQLAIAFANFSGNWQQNILVFTAATLIYEIETKLKLFVPELEPLSATVPSCHKNMTGISKKRKEMGVPSGRTPKALKTTGTIGM
jgi:hypothetical protein